MYDVVEGEVEQVHGPVLVGTYLSRRGSLRHRDRHIPEGDLAIAWVNGLERADHVLELGALAAGDVATPVDAYALGLDGAVRKAAVALLGCM
ncbi:hypothetical protein [Streptomyces sp. NPDC090036]|uniref:hypothetical protein n=1 Tax=Streptomyces sp. NPDC090036 TaxID=3365926 RepID=UPI00380A391F